MSILAAIDENERSRTVATIAADLAATYDEPLVALHVVPNEDFEEHKAAIERVGEQKSYSFTQEESSAEQFVRAFVEESVDDFGDLDFEARGRVGDVTEEILAEAESLDPRYLVISGRRRSPSGKAVFGSTAQRLLLNAECPVVTKLSDQ